MKIYFPILQLQTQQLMTSHITSGTEYLIQKYGSLF